MVCNYRKTFGQPMISTPEGYSELNTELRRAIIQDINFEMRKANDNETWLFSHEYPTGSSISWQSVKDQIPTDTLIGILRELQRLNNHPISEVEEEIVKRKRNPIDEIIGTWPGNETDEEFEKMLKDLD